MGRQQRWKEDAHGSWQRSGHYSFGWQEPKGEDKDILEAKEKGKNNANAFPTYDMMVVDGAMRPVQKIVNGVRQSKGKLRKLETESEEAGSKWKAYQEGLKKTFVAERAKFYDRKEKIAKEKAGQQEIQAESIQELRDILLNPEDGDGCHPDEGHERVGRAFRAPRGSPRRQKKPQSRSWRCWKHIVPLRRTPTRRSTRAVPMTPVVVPKRPNLTSRIERSATVHNRCHLCPADPSRRPARCLPRCTAAVPLADKLDLRCREIANDEPPATDKNPRRWRSDGTAHVPGNSLHCTTECGDNPYSGLFRLVPPNSSILGLSAPMKHSGWLNLQFCGNACDGTMHTVSVL